MVARFALARMRFVGSPWTRRSETPILGLTGSTGEPHGEVVASMVSTENRPTWGTTRRRAWSTSRAPRRRPRARGHPDQREVAPHHRRRAPDRRARRGVPAVPGRPAEPADLPRRSACGCGAAARAGRKATSRRSSSSGATTDNFYLYRAPAAKSTTWEPEFVIDLETWRRLRAEVESRWLAASRRRARPSAAHRSQRLRGVRWALPGARSPIPGSIRPIWRRCRRSRPASTRRGDGHEPTRRALGGRHPAERSRCRETGTAASVDARLAASDVGS